MASRTVEKTSKSNDEAQVLHVTWHSGTETLDLLEIERAAGPAEAITITTMEIRADDIIVAYAPKQKSLSGSSSVGFSLTYDHPGTWLSGEATGKDADGDRGSATYKREKADGAAAPTWKCSWKGENGLRSNPKCRLSAPNAARVYAAYTRAVRDRAFRTLILQDAPRCAISGETQTCVLDAAHILPVSDKGRDEATNGIVLRKDLHALFDAGYLGINEKGEFRLNAELPSYSKLIDEAEPFAAAKVPAVLKNIKARNARA